MGKYGVFGIVLVEFGPGNPVTWQWYGGPPVVGSERPEGVLGRLWPELDLGLGQIGNLGLCRLLELKNMGAGEDLPRNRGYGAPRLPGQPACRFPAKSGSTRDSRITPGFHSLCVVPVRQSCWLVHHTETIRSWDRKSTCDLIAWRY
jgi:hypothetical protein